MLPWNRKFQVAPPATQTVNSKKPLNLERCNELVKQLSKETFSKKRQLVCWTQLTGGVAQPKHCTFGLYHNHSVGSCSFSRLALAQAGHNSVISLLYSSPERSMQSKPNQSRPEKPQFLRECPCAMRIAALAKAPESAGLAMVVQGDARPWLIAKPVLTCQHKLARKTVTVMLPKLSPVIHVHLQHMPLPPSSKRIHQN